MAYRVRVLAAAASVTACANASEFTVDLKISRDGVVWQDSISDFVVGDRVQCAIFIRSDFSVPVYGVGGATLQQTGLRDADLHAGETGSENFRERVTGAAELGMPK